MAITLTIIQEKKSKQMKFSEFINCYVGQGGQSSHTW